jgi:hypothetical protein
LAIIVAIIVAIIFNLDSGEKFALKTYLFTSPTNYNHYRLSDMICSDYNKNFFMGKKYHMKHYPNSIVSKYFTKTNKIKQYNILKNIIDNYKLEENSINYENTLIVHLRAGEVIEFSKHSAKEYFEKEINWSHFNTSNYVKPKKYYETILNKNKDLPKNVLFFKGGCFSHGKTRKSEEYLKLVENFFESHNFKILKNNNNNKLYNPDEDFVKMSKSKYFIQSGGGFSELISKMVKLRGGKVYNKDINYV